MGSAQKRVLFHIVDEMRLRYPLETVLHFSGLSKSGYYKWKQRENTSGKASDIESHILAIHSIRPYYGYRRMTVALRREGFSVNHKRVYRLMKALKIQSVIRKKRRFFGKSGSLAFPDLLQRNFTSPAPGRKLATDITYLPTRNGFMYLSAVQDMSSNEIVAYSLSARNNLDLVFSTLEQLTPFRGAILHSDQGFQYTHKTYAEKLTTLKLYGSHSRKGNCLDNAAMESFFSHLKTEAFAGKELLGREETVTLVQEYIHFYNTERFQKRLGQLSPVEYRKKLAA
jgi:Transposase and inactivated derivatives